MKVQFILFFLFLSVSNCNDYLVQIPWDGTYMTNLNTHGTNYFYVAISNSRTYGNFELYFEDRYFYLSTNLYFMALNIEPTMDIIRNYNFSLQSSYKSINDYYGTKQYYYSYNYRKNSNQTLYVVFRYYGDYSSGTLKVKCTNDDPYPTTPDYNNSTDSPTHTDSPSRTDSPAHTNNTDSADSPGKDSNGTNPSNLNYPKNNDYNTDSPNKKDSYSTDKVAKVVGTSLSVVAIVFIAIGSLIGLEIIITIIVFICICTRKKTTYGSVGFIQPQQPSSVIASNPVTDPLNPPNLYPNPNIYPNTNLYPNRNIYPNTNSYPNPNLYPNTNPNPNSNPNPVKV